MLAAVNPSFFAQRSQSRAITWNPPREQQNRHHLQRAEIQARQFRETDGVRYRPPMKEGNALENQNDSAVSCMPNAVSSVGTTAGKREDLLRRDGWNRYTFRRCQRRNHSDIRVKFFIRPEQWWRCFCLPRNSSFQLRQLPSRLRLEPQ